MPQRTLTDEQEAEVTAAYVAGASGKQLAVQYGTSDGAIYRAINRHGVGRRTPMGTRTKWRNSSAQRAEVIRLYTLGRSVHELSKQFVCRTAVISDLLADEQVPLHPGGRKHPSFTASQEVEVARAYAAGESLRDLAERYLVSTPTVVTVLRRQGVEAREPKRPQFWTDACIAKLRSLHIEGRSQPQIAAQFGVSVTAVNRRLQIIGEVAPKPRNKGPAHHSWKGGRSKNGEGYVLVQMTDEDRPYGVPNASGYIPEHRLVMGRALGRPLARSESVHHINGDKTDNRLENLQLRQGKHGAGVVFRCRSCGSHDVEAVPLAGRS